MQGSNPNFSISSPKSSLLYPKIHELVTRIQNKQPLILNVTNYVTMDFIANGLLSLGASPIMIQSTEEVSDLLKISAAVVINIGTLTDDFLLLCEQVCREANQLGIPITLDPVGAGASTYRTKACLNLLEQFDFAIIRGNSSEIMALSGAQANTKGVDSTMETHAAIESAQRLSSQHKAVIVISGKIDAVIDAEQVQLFERGSSLMPRITGSGCLLSAVTSAFDAVHPQRYEAVSAAVLFYSVCGEIAARKANAPGSFKPYFIDALSFLPELADYT
ncbi:MAG: hydroxyethylthiazole kinase [Legionellaceae bacterium]|nr:hydroxyethylthiazole kinase [Legionellaceae bacterium]